MKGITGLGVAVAALVIAFAPSAGAGPYPNDGKIYLKNMSSQFVNIGLSEGSLFFTIAPRGRYLAYNLNRFEDVYIDFDSDLDLFTDATYYFNLDGDKVHKHVIGDLGIYSLTNQD
jgi:hypothetical protein